MHDGALLIEGHVSAVIGSEGKDQRIACGGAPLDDAVIVHQYDIFTGRRISQSGVAARGAKRVGFTQGGLPVRSRIR